MKKMKTTILTSVALAACVSTQLFAQTVVKQDTITISLTGAKQLSVSTSATVLNAGNWSSGPMFYKTTPVKVTDKDIIKYIAASLWGNANHYGSKAKLVLVQGELSGFFNITESLGLSRPDNDGNPSVDPWFNDMGGTADADLNTALANSQDSTFFTLANGRHWDVNPVTGSYPVGHLQPWGQIYIQDPDSTDDNVTLYFAISVQECYDCFYLNSFVSTATFKTVSTTPNGPPCCVGTSVIVGSGVDKYYMTFSFDNTPNNSYLFGPLGASSTYFGDEVGNDNVAGVNGAIDGDAIVPDTIRKKSAAVAAEAVYNAVIAGGGTTSAALKAKQLVLYVDPIKGAIGGPSPYQARFTVNGILTYSWKLANIDKQDLSPDFMGTGKFVGNGYGFIALYCGLFDTATINFAEKAVKAGTTITGEDWTANWIGIGSEYVLDGETTEPTTPYENWVNLGKPTYQWGSGETYNDVNGAHFIYPTPINVSTSLSRHENFNTQYPANTANNTYSAWPAPAYVKSLSWDAPVYP